MRFESKEFILSRRQSEESRELKDADHLMKIKPVSERAQAYLRKANPKALPSFRSMKTREEKVSDDSRDESTSTAIVVSGTPSDEPSLPVDLSNREVQRLVKLRETRKRELALAAKQEREDFCSSNRQTTFDQSIQNLMTSSVDAFLKARELVRQSNKERGIDSSQAIDDMIQYLLPSHMWMGKLMTDSKSAVRKIQTKMQVEYDRESWAILIDSTNETDQSFEKFDLLNRVTE